MFLMRCPKMMLSCIRHFALSISSIPKSCLIQLLDIIRSVFRFPVNPYASNVLNLITDTALGKVILQGIS